MKENLKPIEIANKIIQESGINVFENNRRKYNVEMRSLLCFLLREKLNMRWLNIAKFFNDNNKSMTHASCIHAFKNYKMYKKTNSKLFVHFFCILIFGFAIYKIFFSKLFAFPFKIVDIVCCVSHNHLLIKVI